MENSIPKIFGSVDVKITPDFLGKVGKFLDFAMLNSKIGKKTIINLIN